MTVEERLESLRTKHTMLESLIAEENRRPLPDDFKITELKREKLRIKDEMATMET